MDLDLNREPVQAQSHAGESPGRLLVELGDRHGRIEERIRLLESVVARARFRSPLPSSSTSPTPISTITVNTTESNVIGSIPQPRDGCIKAAKIDGGFHLLAEALAMDSTCEQNLPSTSASVSIIKRKPGGSVYDCNICFSLCKDPILTCCGHLFCWPCFYCLPNSDSYASKECPVCQGEVSETDITPIYGVSSSDDSVAPASSSSNHPIAPKIPPRPRAHRIDSVRQRVGYPPLPPNQRVTQIFVHPSLLATSNTLAPHTSPSPSPSPSQVAHHFSRLLSQAEHIESHVNMQQAPTTQAQPLPFHVGNAHSGNPVTDGINDSYEAAMSRSSSSSRRASNDVGLVFRNRQRRRDGVSR